MIKRHIKDVIKATIRNIGYDLRPYDKDSNPDALFLKTLSKFNPDLVLDVGANRGQFAKELRSTGYRGKIVSFEPLSAEHAALTQAAKEDDLWLINPRCAVGDRDGSIKINIAANSGSSSVLPMLDLHVSAAPESAYVGEELVPLYTLNTLAPQYLRKSRSTILKMDTQGFEWEVLDGSLEVLPHINGIICELSLAKLYGGSRLWIEMAQRIEKEGFTLWSIHPGFSDPRNGRMLQVDATFFRI